MAKPVPSRRKERALQELRERAVEAHQNGQLAEAEKLYLQILATDPHHFDAPPRARATLGRGTFLWYSPERSPCNIKLAYIFLPGTDHS